MKRSIFIFALVLLSIGVVAQSFTASVTIQLKSQTNNTSEVYLFEASNFGYPLDTRNCAKLFPYTTNSANVNVFVQLDGINYAQFATKKVSNLPLGIITNREVAANQNYKLIFSDVEGRSLKFVDKVMSFEKVIPSEGFTYDFTVNTTNCPSYVAGTNVTIADRFVLEPFEPETGDLEVCHSGDNLEVKKNPFATNIVVKNADGQKVIDQMPRATPQVISLNTLSKGRYTVEFNDGKEVFVIEVKPDVTPVQ